MATTTPKYGEIHTKKQEMLKEMIGMTLPGIEDYNSFYNDSEESTSSDVTTHSLVSNVGMIRESFQVIPTAFKLGVLPMPLPPLAALSISSSIDPKDAIHKMNHKINHNIYMHHHDQKIEEEPNEVISKSETMKINSQTTARTVNHVETQLNIKKRLSVLTDLELEESSSSTTPTTDTDTEDDSYESDETADSDSNTKEESSSWGSGEDTDSDEGGITYLSTLKQADSNTNKFTLTPFDSVIDESQKSLHRKYDKITYPTGSKFYSEDLLQTEDYHRLQNIQLVKWIKSDNYDMDENKTDTEHKTQRDKKVEMSLTDKQDIFEWLKQSINKVYTYYHGKHRNDLKNCFHLIDGNVFEHFAGDNWKLMLRPEHTENYELFKLFELLLHTFARLATKLHANGAVLHRFYYYLEHTKKIFPKYKVHLDLLKETHKAHVNKYNANHCIQSFVRIYYKHQHFTFEGDLPQFQLCCKALVALDLYMENYSPLSHTILSDKAAYDIDHESFKWLDGFNKYKEKDKGSDTEEEDDELEEEERLHLLKLELCNDPIARINKLTVKYKQFRGFSFLRARISWVIGHSKLYHQRNFYHSEKYFFESLYCLKKLCKYEYFPLNNTMQTELASLVLIDYADVLLENKKYRYAINVLEKVIDCLQLRQQHQQKFQIIRKLCITCTEKEDWNRAIKYHNITLKRLQDNYLNLNEFVYLSQQISQIHLKLNNFNQSEKELQNGIKTIYLNVLSYHNNIVKSHNMDNLHNVSINKIFEHCEGKERISIGSLILVLANLYISGGNYLQQAINLLTYLRKHIFTNKSSTRILILFQLSRAYFKHGRYAIADNIIEKEILSRYPSRNDKLLSSLEFIQLRILIMIKQKRFADALKLLDPEQNDIISDIIQKESFVKRAKINYLKGCVLQSRCFHKLIKNYEKEKERVRIEKKRQLARQSAKIVITKPSEIDDYKHDEEEKKEQPAMASPKPQHRRGGFGPRFGPNNSNKQDINPLDAQSALLLSHSDFRTVQDGIMQAKCCLELGKTYLEIIMEYYALPTFVLRDTLCSDGIIKWLGFQIFNDDETPNDEVIIHCLDEINLALYQSLNLCTRQTKDVGLLIESYIALAEFEFLKSETTKNIHDKPQKQPNQTSKNFWQQSKIAFFTTYKDSDDWIFLRRIDRHSRLQIFNTFKRILRLLICFDSKFIADNVEIFVSYISLETFMVAQNDIYVEDDKNSKKKKKNVNNNIPQTQFKKKNNNKSKDFSRYNSAAIYRNSYSINSVVDNTDKDKNKHVNKDNDDGDEDKDVIIRNATVTLRISDLQHDGLAKIQLSADASLIRPLYPRYRDFTKEKEKKLSDIGGEKYLDELFRMHWKMKTESNQFSGGGVGKNNYDNDRSLVSITKCISSLQVKDEELDMNRTLNRKYRSWKANETFIISLDSIVFLFHPHTLFKYAINKKRNQLPNYNQLKLFTSILTNIAFHDTDFLPLEDNPWINKQHSVSIEKKEDYIHNKEEHNKRIRMRLNAGKKRTHNLATDKLLLLQNELTLPYLKLESVSELLMCLDPQNILSLIGAIFSECQIILVSKERCRCLAIIDALFDLMYPFNWQYPCIPWLSPACFESLKLPIPYIFGIANITKFNNMLLTNKYDICDKAYVIDLDTNNLMKPSSNHLPFFELPLKIKSKLTRAMFRLMSHLLKNAFHDQVNGNYVFPPRRRNNMNKNNRKNIKNKYNLLSSPRTAPISICSERKKWFVENNKKLNIENEKMTEMIINFQKEFCAAFVEILEQYRLFWVNINSAFHKDLKSKSTDRIQKYAHPRYRNFLSEIQKTRMFSSFQCIRSLANTDMLQLPMFDNLVMQSLKWRQSLYHEIIKQQQQEKGRMKVSVENSKKRYFINHECDVEFDPKDCKLYIKPDTNFVTKQTHINLLPFEVILKATDYELTYNTTNIKHPYIDPRQVQKYGQRYQFTIKHQKDGTLTLNCKNYYELTRWIHMIRTHSMDTWSWFLKF